MSSAIAITSANRHDYQSRRIQCLAWKEITMDDSPEETISGELGTNEELLWAGRPPLGLMFRPVEAFLIPLSIFWSGFAIFWMVAASTNGGGWFALFGIPFLLVGFYLLIGRFWLDVRQRERTFYAVTSDRVVILSGWLTRRVKSLAIDTLTDVSLSERSGSRGTITFGPVPPMHWLYSGAGWPTFGHWHAVPNFELAEGAREVYEIIRRAQRDAKQRPV
jgi:hypothetical protein